MIELVTKHGWKFWSSAEVVIGDKRYDMDELSEKQRNYIGAKLNEQGMNAAYAGRIRFKAEGLPSFEEVFGEG